MPYARPTLSALLAQVVQDINTGGLPVDATLRHSILRKLGEMQAGFANLHYEYQDWIANQAVPWTATDEYLAGWGALRGVSRIPPAAATGTVSFTGTASTAVLPGGTALTTRDGFAFVTTADATADINGTITAPVTASVGGSAGNVLTGAIVTLSNPVANVGNAGTVVLISGGADIEGVEAYRARIMQVYAAPPQGGARTDYVEWALGVAGVTRAWVAPSGAGTGTVVLYVMEDITQAAFGGFPQGTNGVAAGETRATPIATGDLLIVANAIYPLQPVTALVYVNRPTPAPVNFSIVAPGALLGTSLQASVTATLNSMFLREANVGGTIDPDAGTAWPPLEPSLWYDALASGPNLPTFQVTSPSGPITPAAGTLPTLGTVTLTTS